MHRKDFWSELFIGMLIVLIITGFILYIVDIMTGRSVLGIGAVSDKEYRAAYTSYHTHTDSEGRSKATSTYHPAQYTLVIIVDSIGIRSLSVSSWAYYSYTVHEKVITHGTIGGISNLYYLRDISKMKSAEQ